MTLTFKLLTITITISWPKRDKVRWLESERRIARLMDEVENRRAKHSRLL